MPLFNSGGLGLSLVNSGLGLGLKNLVLELETSLISTRMKRAVARFITDSGAQAYHIIVRGINLLSKFSYFPRTFMPE